MSDDGLVNGEVRTLLTDVLALLEGVTCIQYGELDRWQREDEEEVHPLVPRLRSLVHARAPLDTEMQLREEKRVSDRLRFFTNRVYDLCHEKGMGKDVTNPIDVLTWLDRHCV